MTVAILYKLLALTATVLLGYVAARMHWLARPGEGDAARMLGNAAFYLFVPALLFRTTARLDVAHMPWRTVFAFFVPVLALLMGVYAWHRSRPAAPAAPATQALTVAFGNSVQLGIPFAAALFGESGLAIHVSLISLHALVLLSVTTALVELDIARAHAGAAAQPLARTLARTARNTLIHPVVLPVLAGLAWNVAGLGIHPVADEAMAVLASAVVPVCLVLIGVGLASYGLRGHVRQALPAVLLKLFVMPALVLAAARWGFGLRGQPLAVVVMLAALPVGSNPLIFAQRYQTLEAETTAAIVISTVAFAGSATLWLALLALLG